MDSGPASAAALRAELTAFLRRHAEDPADVDDARLVVSELVGNAVHHAGGPVWEAFLRALVVELARTAEADQGPAVVEQLVAQVGATVRQAPALCRMTSSGFGGIAARNHDDAVVLLDERIAVGDPECRVTVLLGAAARNNPGGHHYRAPS
jgi:hypothetical protein